MPERVSTERLEEMLAGLEGVTPGPWFYHTHPLDDWGTIRVGDDGTGCVWRIANVRAGRNVTDEEKDQHRRDETDPYGANAAHIARCDPDTMRSILTELLASRQAPEGVRVTEAARLAFYSKAEVTRVGSIRNLDEALLAALSAIEPVTQTVSEEMEGRVQVIEQSDTLDGGYALTLELDGRDTTVVVYFKGASHDQP